MIILIFPLQNTNIKVYVNAMIVSTVTLLGYIVAGTLINYLGKKKLICEYLDQFCLIREDKIRQPKYQFFQNNFLEKTYLL